MATPLKIEPVDATFGAVVTGFRIPEIDDETFQALHAAWLKYALLIFPGQNLTRGRADRLRQALRTARVRDDGDQQRQGGRHACGSRRTTTTA